MGISRSQQRGLSYGLWTFIVLIPLIPAIIGDVQRYGDSSDYVMMGSSIAYDGDLVYSGNDLSRMERLKPHGTDFPAGMFLIRDTSNRLLIGGHSFYYSLAAAPFFRVFGVRGFQIFNALLWILVAVLLFRRFHTDAGYRRYGLILAGLFFSTPYAYILWQTPATWLLFLSACFIHFYAERRLLTAGIFLGLAGASQYPLWLWVLIPCIDVVRRRLSGDGLIMILCAAVVSGAPQVLYFRFVTGTWHVTWLDLGTPARYLYYPFNFPGEPEFDRTRHAIVFARFSRIGHLDPIDLLRALASFRFGLIWFYPFAVFAALRMIRERSDWAPAVVSLIILGSFCTAGKLETHQVGLRYLNPIYPVFLLGFRRMRFDTVEKILLCIVVLLGLTFAVFPHANSMEAYSYKMTPHAIIERLGG